MISSFDFFVLFARPFCPYAQHEERTYFPATIFDPAKGSSLVPDKNFFQYALPGAHCDVGGHYTSNLVNQQLSFHAMVELAKRAGVPLGDGTVLDSQLTQYYNNPFQRLLKRTDKIEYNSYAEGLDVFMSEIDKNDGLRRAYQTATGTDNGYFRVPSKAEIEQHLKDRDVNKFKPGEIGVQFEAYPTNQTIWERAADFFDQNDQKSQHGKRLFPDGYRNAATLHEEWAPFGMFFQEFGRLYMHPKGQKGFAK